MSKLNKLALTRLETLPTGSEIIVGVSGKPDLYTISKEDFTAATAPVSAGPTTIVVDITATEITGVGSFLIKDLLPDISPNYYKGSVRLEFTPGNIPYTVAGGIGFLQLYTGNQNQTSTIAINMLTKTSPAYVVIPFNTPASQSVFDSPTVDGNVYYAETNDYTPIYLYTQQADISLGNGTLKAIITYEEVVFGV